MMSVPMLDPWNTYGPIEGKLTEVFQRVLRSGRYILGREVAEFESSVGKWVGAEHCVGMSSGTDALLATLLALDIGPGDEVITSPLTFVSTAEVILRAGAMPVFAEVCPTCLCIDPKAVQPCVSSKTRAILNVDLFGQLGHIRELQTLASEYSLALVEDACQAFGSKRLGKCAGTFGRAGCFSFFPSKPLGGFGDAGLVATDDAELATRLRTLRSHGGVQKGDYSSLGGNFRIDALHSALLNELLSHLDEWILLRKNAAESYTRALTGQAKVATPKTCDGVDSSWGVYTIRVPQHRDALAAHLAQNGIETAIYYPRTLAEQRLFQASARVPQELKIATAATREVLALPIYPGLHATDLTRVVSSICGFFNS